MKNTIKVLVFIIAICAAMCMFVACGNDDVTINGYEKIEDDVYKVGDEFKESDGEIVATFSDGSTKKITNNLVFDGKEALKLDDDGKFTSESVETHKITVYALEKRDDYKIGEWTITVGK